MGILRKTKSKLFKFVLRKCTLKMRGNIYRNLLKIPSNLDKKIIFKIADTKDELSSAFNLLHKEYVNSGYMTSHKSLMRLTIFHALPSTTTLIAKREDVVIGTVSIVCDNKFGLPLEKIFSTSTIRIGKEKKVAEISALAINQDLVKNRGEINLPLTKFLFEYGKFYLKCNIFVIAVNPNWEDYYKSIWGFEKLPKTNSIENYSYVDGAPAVGLFLDLDTCRENLISIYYNRFPREKDFYSYLFKTKISNFNFPDRTFKTVTDPVMTPFLLNYFFNKCSDIFSNLSEDEKVQLHFLYLNLNGFDIVLPKIRSHYISKKEEREIYLKAREVRYETICKAVLTSDSGELIHNNDLKVLNVSKYGIAIKSCNPIPADQLIELRVEVGFLTISTLMIKVCHIGDGFTYGAQVIKFDDHWIAFIDYLKNNLVNENHSKELERIAS